MNDTRRSDFIQSLHRLADILDNDSGLPIPHGVTGYGRAVTWYIQHDVADALNLADVMTDPKVVRDGSATFPVQITGRIAGLAATVEISARLAFAPGVVTPAWPPLVTELAALNAVPSVSA